MNPDARDGAVWNLFTDWCAAVGEQPLPAEPMTLARFLAAHPAAVATQRRRVGAVNAMHRREGRCMPGHAQTVRDLLDGRRRVRRQERALAAGEAIRRLPEQGWPTLLFAHRDAMLLVLTAAGLAATEISGLRIGDVHADPLTDTLRVGEATTPESLIEQGISPVQIHRDWINIRNVQDRLPSTRAVTAAVQRRLRHELSEPAADLTLFTPIDRWGASPLRSEPLTAAAIAVILRNHLNGSAPAHTQLRQVPPNVDTAEPAQLEQIPEPAVLDADTFNRGVAARRRSAEILDGVGDALDEVEARADALLAELLELLDEPGPKDESNAR